MSHLPTETSSASSSAFRLWIYYDSTTFLKKDYFFYLVKGTVIFFFVTCVVLSSIMSMRLTVVERRRRHRRHDVDICLPLRCRSWRSLWCLPPFDLRYRASANVCRWSLVRQTSMISAAVAVVVVALETLKLSRSNWQRLLHRVDSQPTVSIVDDEVVRWLTHCYRLSLVSQAPLRISRRNTMVNTM